MVRAAIALVACLGMVKLAHAGVEIEEVTSPGGIDAWLVEEHSIPFTALELYFEGGTSLDREDALGATSLMMALLEEGAGEMDARAFAAAREELAADISFDAGLDSVTVSVRFLTENRNEAIALLRAALNEPRFDTDAVERVRGQLTSVIRSDEQDPSFLARRAFYESAFEGHPYAYPSNGTVESVAALTREDLITAKDAVMVRERVHVGAVGDITAEELGAILDEVLTGLPETGATLPADIEFNPPVGPLIVPYDTSQSLALFAQQGIDRASPDFFPAFVMNHILGGGGFSSRLTEEVREKRGLSYGIATYLVLRNHANMIMGQVATANETAGDVIDVVRDEWQRMADGGVTDAELNAAITYLTGAYPLRFDGNSRIAGTLASMQMVGLDVDYINTRNDQVAAVTREDIARVAAQYLNSDDLFFAIAGQPEGIAEAQ
nr:pitrilysin family protein [Cochlodiniinecator piscidefendens]